MRSTTSTCATCWSSRRCSRSRWPSSSRCWRPPGKHQCAPHTRAVHRTHQLCTAHMRTCAPHTSVVHRTRQLSAALACTCLLFPNPMRTAASSPPSPTHQFDLINDPRPPILPSLQRGRALVRTLRSGGGCTRHQRAVCVAHAGAGARGRAAGTGACPGLLSPNGGRTGGQPP